MEKHLYHAVVFVYPSANRKTIWNGFKASALWIRMFNSQKTSAKNKCGQDINASDEWSH